MDRDDGNDGGEEASADDVWEAAVCIRRRGGSALDGPVFGIAKVGVEGSWGDSVVESLFVCCESLLLTESVGSPTKEDHSSPWHARIQ